MALETGDYLGDLTITNPTAADPKSQGDDHIRLIKKTARQSFPGFTGAIVVTGTVGGTADVITLTPATALVAYTAPMLLVFEPGAANTGAVTVNISALGAKSLKTDADAELVAGDLVSGEPIVAAYDGAAFRLLHPTKRYIDALAFSAALPLQTGNSGKFTTTNGTSASWATIAPTDISGFSATAAQVRTGTSVVTALSPGDTYSALAEVTLTDAATIAVDMSSFINARVTLGGNRTLGNPTNPKVGQAGYIAVVQDGTGSRTLAYGGNWKRSGGAPTLSTAAGTVDYIFYTVISASLILYSFAKAPT